MNQAAEAPRSRGIVAVLVFAAALVLALVMLPGCASSDEQAAREAADGFLSALNDGDISKANEYCTSDAADVLNDASIDTIKSAFYDSVGLSEDEVSDEVKDSINSLYDTLMQNLVTSYTINSVSVDGDTATVEADITWGYDPDKVNDLDVSDELSSLASTYESEHGAEIATLYQQEGYDAALNKVLSDIIPQAVDAYKNALNNLGSKEETSTITLNKQDDGSWKVTDA